MGSLVCHDAHSVLARSARREGPSARVKRSTALLGALRAWPGLAGSSGALTLPLLGKNSCHRRNAAFRVTGILDLIRWIGRFCDIDRCSNLSAGGLDAVDDRPRRRARPRINYVEVLVVCSLSGLARRKSTRRSPQDEGRIEHEIPTVVVAATQPGLNGGELLSGVRATSRSS
jgi:hypothetical protein